MTYAERIAEQMRKERATFADLAAACRNCVETMQKALEDHGLEKRLSPIEVQMLELAKTFEQLAAQPLPLPFYCMPVAGSA